MHYPVTHVLLITSISMGVLFLVLTALAVMVNQLNTFMPESDTSREAETVTIRLAVELPDADELDQIAAVAGVAFARARAGLEHRRLRGTTPRLNFNPWRDLPRSRTMGYLDRGWRPR